MSRALLSLPCPASLSCGYELQMAFPCALVPLDMQKAVGGDMLRSGSPTFIPSGGSGQPLTGQ